MDEETQVSDEVVESAIEEAEQKEAPKQGTDFQEFDEKTQQRFNRVYRNMKQYERIVEEQGGQLKSALEKLEDMEAQLEAAQTSEQVEALKAEKVAALEEGDYQRAVDIDERMMEVSKPKEAAPPPQPEPAPTLSLEDQARLETWALERDESGQLKRPWASDGHPLWAKTRSVTEAALADPNLGNLDQILAEVDRVMLPPKVTRTTSGVMSSADNPRPTQSKTPELTPDQKIAADKMGISHKRYAEALTKWT